MRSRRWAKQKISCGLREKGSLWGDSSRVSKVLVLSLNKTTLYEAIRNRHVAAGQIPDLVPD